MAVVEKRLVFNITSEDDTPVIAHVLSLTPFKRVIKDYFMICESYYDAIRTSSPAQIEAIDMGRRGLHNEGSQTLQDRLDGKIEVDFDTARRLFTLICVCIGAVEMSAADSKKTGTNGQASKITSVLFVCSMNSIRSPMAEQLVKDLYPGTSCT